jgi:NAD(P) transhydrogenase subunit beta
MSGVLVMAYLTAGVLFIRSLGGLSKQETARQGNTFGMIGMTVAGVVTVASWLLRPLPGDPTTMSINDLPLLTGGILAVAILIGSGVGAALARRVEMTGMPELVAILHSFVGLAAVLVGFSSYLAPMGKLPDSRVEHLVHLGEVWVGVAVGAITLTGSIIAWGKLKGTITGKPLLLPGRHSLNAVVGLAMVGLAIPFLHSAPPEGTLFSPFSPACSACTWCWPSAAPTCRWWCRCSTATRAGPRRPPASCCRTTCSSSPARWWGRAAPSSPSSCAGR